MANFAHPVFLLIFSFSLFANALTDTILQGQSVTASTPITSSGNKFEFGFFSPGNENSTISSYLGVWYKKVSVQTVVWVANRDHPLTNSSAVLTIATDGNLAIQEGRSSYMLSNTTSSGNTSATLLDTGNLVLIDRRSGDLLWQSFDHPSDTLLPGMKAGYDWKNGKTWSLLAWKSKDDPSPGDFSVQLDTRGKNQFFLLKGSQKYWTSGPWNGKTFVNMPDFPGNPNVNFTFVSNDIESYFTYSFKNPLVTGRAVLHTSGQIQLLTWLEARREWNLSCSRPDQCDIYAYCGAFGTCNRNQIPNCHCLSGFQPKSVGDWNVGDTSGGCVRKVHLQCGNDSEVNGHKDQFLQISKVRLRPGNSIVLSQVRSIGDCQSACFSNCSCSAYTYDGSDGCSIWCGELLNVNQLTDDDPEGRDLYLRLAASEFLSEGKDSRIKRWKLIILAIAVPVALLVTVGFFYCLWRWKSQNKGKDLVLFDHATSIGAANCILNEAGKSHTGKRKEVDLPLFSFASVCAATDNFSDANKLGEGGFGSVYKGKLQKGYKVAVKRLSRKSRQGLEELQNEAMLIARLQHNNLVRLLGCCIEKDEKILIYEYMPNKSLDFFLFDTIFQGQSVTASTTITSSGNEFELGFFSPGIDNSTKSSYLGVWYKRVSIQTVVWVANRDHCLTNSSAVLTIAEDGNLAIQAGRTSYMLSNVTSSGNTSATLLDSGNLVLIDRRSGDLLWQSFDYPSDTFLPGMKLGFDKRNGKNWSLLAWKTKDDPGPGGFSIKLDTQWKNQFSILKGSQKYWTSGPWNGQFFVQQPEMHENPLYKYIFVSNENESYFSYSFKDPSVTGRSVLDISGQMQVLIWLEARGEWNLLYARPGDQCNIYAYCGPFGTCNRNHITYCQCFRGFHPKSIGDWNAGDKSGGCVRKMPLQCGNDSEVNGQKDQFLRISKVRLPDNSIALSQVRSIGDCQSTCFSNCSCSAYTYEGSDGCSIWCEDLLNVDQLADDTTDGRDFYLRLAASEILSKRKDSRIKWWKWIILALAVPMTLLVAVGFFYCLWRRKSQNKGEDLVLFDLGISIGAANCKVNEVGKSCTGKAKVVDLPLFSFASVSTATDNFSDANKLGEGGFGPVYKGKLQKGYEVAVKRLSRKSSQGLQELQNEAMLIAKLQHNNLVRLLGCCIEKDEKILIYEYMPNKSLDLFLFDPIKYGILNWESRVNIIEGIAQGLLYLHLYSRLRIIHRDLKASNILLDKDTNPKISDFGIARIFGGNGSQATNRIVGTYGYMSPEYALEGLFSIKSDVFSFGVLLLEILSGKKNTGFYNTDAVNLLGYAWDLWKSGMGESIRDPLLQDISSANMLLRYVNIALLCVQESAADRPTMSDVALMLSNELMLLASPKQPAFSTSRSVPERNSSKQSEDCSINDATISSLEAR